MKQSIAGIKIKKIITAIGLFLLSIVFFLHIWKLGSIPGGIANDESDYIYTSYTIWATGGHDIQGKFLPLSVNGDSSLSPVQVYLSAPVVGLLGVSAFSGRLPYALVSIGSICVLFFIAKKLFSSSSIAYLSAIGMAIAPWFFVISRGAWDANFALFFFLLGIYLFVTLKEKGNILWSLIPFTLGFYSYHAAKVFFILFIVFLLALYWNDLKSRRKELITFIGLIVGIVSSFLVVTHFQHVTRQDVFIWNNMQEYAKQVNVDRRYSSGTSIEKIVFNNKYTNLVNTVITNYIESFSPELLFTRGEIFYVTAYGIFFKGLFYIIDLPFFLYGLFLLVKERKKSGILVLGSLLIAPIPAALSIPLTHIFHSFMMIPFISIITAIGIGKVLLQIKHIRYEIFRNSAFATLLILYMFFIGRFFYQYFQQFGSYGGQFWNSLNQEVSKYIGNQYSSVDHIYITAPSDREAMMLQYAITNQVDPHVFQKAWNKSTSIQMGKVNFTNDCLHNGEGNPNVFLPPRSIYAVYEESCFGKIRPLMTFNDPIEPLHVVWKVYQKR